MEDKIKSVSQLGNKVLVDNANFEIPAKTQLAQIEASLEQETNVLNTVPKETILSKIFGVRAEAEAKTTK